MNLEQKELITETLLDRIESELTHFVEAIDYDLIPDLLNELKSPIPQEMLKKHPDWAKKADKLVLLGYAIFDTEQFLNTVEEDLYWRKDRAALLLQQFNEQRIKDGLKASQRLNSKAKDLLKLLNDAIKENE